MCDVTAAVVGGSALVGAVGAATSKPKTVKGTSTQVNEPWAPQAEHLQTGMDEAKAIYDRGKEVGPWKGPFSAGQNATQQAGYGNLAGYAQNTGSSLATQAGQNAGSLLGVTQPFLSNAGSLAGNGIGAPNATAQGVLTNTANGQALAGPSASGTAGLGAQNAALGTAQGLSQQASQDPNAGILAGAQGYMNNSLIEGQIDAVNRDVARTLSEETLPGLNARAMGGGTVNSARAGAAEAVARRGAEDRAADNAAAIRSAAYNTGLSTSLAARDQQNALALGSNAQTAAIGNSLSAIGESQRQFDGSSRLNAATTLGAQDLANRQSDASTRLQANGQLGQAALSGYGAAGAAGALSDANSGRLITAGNAQQAEEQRKIQEAMSQQFNQQNYDKAQLRDYWGIVGAQNWGNTSTGTQTQTMPANNGFSGILQGALGGASLGMGLNGLFGGGGPAPASLGPNSVNSPGALSAQHMMYSPY